MDDRIRMTLSSAEITLRAARLEQARSDVERWLGTDRARWQQATERFDTALTAMYPPDWAATVSALQEGDVDAVEPAIAFLEADPRCFRSGYEKERLCRFLGRVELTDAQRRRLLAVVGSASPDPRRPGRERRAFALLEDRLVMTQSSEHR